MTGYNTALLVVTIFPTLPRCLALFGKFLTLGMVHEDKNDRGIFDRRRSEEKFDCAGVVAVQCARHGFYLPQSFVNLIKGEGFSYTDTALRSGLGEGRELFAGLFLHATFGANTRRTCLRTSKPTFPKCSPYSRALHVRIQSELLVSPISAALGSTHIVDYWLINEAMFAPRNNGSSLTPGDWPEWGKPSEDRDCSRGALLWKGSIKRALEDHECVSCPETITIFNLIADPNPEKLHKKKLVKRAWRETQREKKVEKAKSRAGLLQKRRQIRYKRLSLKRHCVRSVGTASADRVATEQIRVPNKLEIF
ncbi:hypothetical protein B0H13DRAFT_1884415 [Mycena leptocephala]|nr:hypothetical protein B0H13DRAFT_1884415 [Mycena leptocephala]